MRVLTHNAYWFQGFPSLWGEERIRAHPQVMRALIQLYGEIAPDVLCVQEVPQAQTRDSLSAALTMNGVFAPGGMRTGYGGAVLWRGESGVVEDLSHTRVGADRVFERICLRYAGSWEGVSATLVNVHLSSNRFAVDGQGEAVRLAELEALFGTGPAPDVVMGDFNATADSRVHAWMRERGYQDAARGPYGCADLPPNCIDYIWVRADGRLMVSACGVVTGTDFRLDEDAGVQLSDHPPLWAELVAS